MNIYRAFRLGALNDLEVGTIVEAVVVSPTEHFARGMVLADDRNLSRFRDWLDECRTRVQLIGVTTDEVDEDRIDGVDVAYTVVVSRKLPTDSGVIQ